MNDDAVPTGQPSRRPDELEDDVLMQQVRAALAPMPTVDRRAIAQILTAVAHRKPTRAERLRAWWEDMVAQVGMATSPLARGAALATVAVVIGFVTRGTIMDREDDLRASRTQPSVAVSAPSASPARAAVQQVDGVTDRAELRVPVQFVLDAREVPAGGKLTVVGDFNNWDVAATPMSLDAGVWSVTLPVSQGRHVYAFVIDGEKWIADPRAPRTKDADFGRPASVVIVQAP